MAAADIKAGRAFVEIYLKGAAAFGKAVDASAARMKAAGEATAAMGKQLGGAGLAMAAPLGASVKSFASLEQALANLKASANPTAAQMDAISAAVDRMAAETGQAPVEVAQAFGELLKAGMSLDQVLGGAAESAIKFAKVGELDVATAATVMNDALNVFAKQGLKAGDAVDILSKAADASSVSIEQIAQGFSMSSAVFGNAGMTMQDLATSLGILGNAGVKGSDAGTSMKTMLLRLQTGAESAGEVMDQLGIKVRDGAGNMLPMEQIVGELQRAMAGLSGQARDQAMLKLFGTDAIRAGSILLDKGAKGFRDFGDAMKGSLGTGDKFKIMMDTTEGDFAKLKVAVLQAAITVGKVLGPPVRQAAQYLSEAAGMAMKWVESNRQVVTVIGAVAVGLVAAGGAMLTLGVALKGLGVAAGLAFKPIALGLGVMKAIVSPIGLAAAAIGGLVAWVLKANGAGQALATSFGAAFQQVGQIFSTTMGGIKDALAAGDLGLAAKIGLAGLEAAWLAGTEPLRKIWSDFRLWFANGVGTLWAGAQTAWALGLNALETGMAETISFLKLLWIGFKETMEDAWHGIKQGTAKGGSVALAVAGVDTGEVDKAIGKLDEQHKARQLERSAANNAEANRIEQERQARIAAAEAKKNASLVAIDKAMRDGAKASGGDWEQREREARERLARAKAELEALARKAAAMASGAATGALAGAAAGMVGGGAGGVKIPGIAEGVDAAMGKMASRGTFNVSALQSLQSGGPAAEIAKNTRDTAKNTKKLIDRVADLSPLFI